MKQDEEKLSRRELLVRGGWLTLGVAIAGLPCDLLAAEVAMLDVAYAGSMGSLMEGPIKSTAAEKLKLELYGRAQGSSALVQLIVGGSIWPDVFIPISAARAGVLHVRRHRRGRRQRGVDEASWRKQLQSFV